MRLIDADAAVDRYYAEWDKKDICDGAQDRDWLKQCIDEAPTIDPKDLRPRGRWNEYPRAHYFKCSECKYIVPYRKAVEVNGKREYNFCPNCGAKMREEVPNE